jgi:ribosomal protein S27AE
MTPSRQKIDLNKVLEALVETCPNCGKSLAADDRMRLNFDDVQCKLCGAVYQPGKKPANGK